MDLSLSDEQVMLRDSVERFVRDLGGTPVRDAGLLWSEFAALGWLALPLPEDCGGLGGSVLDATLLLEAFGRGLMSTPYISTVILCAGLVQTLGTEAQTQHILPAVASGELRMALAHTEAGPRGSPVPLTTVAFPVEGGWQLNGRKIAVMDAAGAATLIVSARVGDEIGLFLVPRETAGLSVISHAVTGGGEAAGVTLTDVRIATEARLGDGDMTVAIEAAGDAAIAAACAEAVGVMVALLEATTAYTHTREQFGKPLFTNQSVRFKLADMAVALEEGRSLALRAALKLSTPQAERIRAVAAAKVGVSRAARQVAELAIQLHGAMGVTEELTIGAYYKRAIAFEAMFGSSDHHLVRHARASGRLACDRNAP